MPILIGTASWTDKTLISCGRFYPPEAKSAEARLRHYASVFPLVEVDSSYYAMPTAANAALWAERTPADFVFDVKAFRLFTGHQTDLKVLPKDIQEALGPRSKPIYYRDVPLEIQNELWRRFKEALWPLESARKLGAVLFQFPPWLLRNKPGHDHVAHCVEHMEGYAVSVEFRNQTWWAPEHREATLRFEHELGVSHVIVDGPQGFANSVPQVWEVTNPQLTILRLHGRNTATWNVKGQTAASDRFNYDYSEAELAAFVLPVREIASKAKAVHVVFNNNFEDQGQRNARAFAALIGVEAP